MPESKATMVRILVVEDNERLLDTLTGQLGLEPGFEVNGVQTIADARKAFARTPDMVLLEASLPDGDGRDLCRWIRGKGHDLPILMLTGRNSEMDDFGGLEAGASDYIPKPLRLRDLTARIKIHLDRYRSRCDSRIPVGPFVFNPGNKTLAHGQSGEIRTLTEKESAIIGYLAGKNGGPAGTEALLQEVWGYSNGQIVTHTLETHIYRLRRKMSGMDKTRVLMTDSDGYCLRT